ncbi:ABC transporter ATP-binding protein [Saccharolobus solfataricus]|nr:ABC transporter ATP-binding protein [Saccharolobus solfataricus]AKA72880.1 ABC transporter ATP-binding protein [Saccharolobus solfataricus]AKA75579.1 ABC transporter ATP-binding protein [Saccharolobus solfataricus]AKA78272.1 ABC transporter ATP-binding protein [Saccharolobus solfataricus]AZF67390.1 ABC transporter ATP-binding protein [Saccharolobus solfataricus]AZF70010.1 ABC transporter ATP-binding protein [Saccharolobus solfataricus]
MILEVHNLNVIYDEGNSRIIKAVNDVSFGVEKGEILGIIGESGSGKTTLISAILRAIRPPGKIISGKVIFNGMDIFSMTIDEFRKLLWKDISYVPQASQNALNPVLPISEIFYHEAISHGEADKKRVIERASELLKLVGLDPARVLKMYPFQLSGGMKQRVMIALSLLLNPKLILMDEPTSALDMLNQELLLKLIKNINQEMGVTIVYVTHDILNIAQIANRLLVMYKGYVMEEGKTEEIIKSPLNPYTSLLVSSIPSLKGEVKVINVPLDEPLVSKEKGCPFLARCSKAFGRCKEELPEIRLVYDRKVRCHLYGSNGA